MSANHTDTHPSIEAFRLELLRNTPAWRKLQLMGGLNSTAKELAMSGLRARHLQANEAELRRRLADLLLGEGIAARVFGPLREVEHGF